MPRCAAVIGAGPAGLMAAERLASAGARVTVHDRMPSVARKFLLAGRGGLNLTHSEPLDRLLPRYGEARLRLQSAISDWTPEALQAWCAGLGVETFVGSSGRVFPSSFKSSPLLRAWLGRLEQLGVTFALRRRWTGWTDDGRLAFDTPEGPIAVHADATILALGGASWPRLGSDGSWAPILADAGLSVTPLKPSNCGFEVAWSEIFSTRFAGQPIKRAAIAFDGAFARGEAVVTADGIEGGMIYALSSSLREAIARDGSALAIMDLRPDLSLEQLAEKLSRPRGKRSASTHLAKTAGLSPIAVGLLREAGPLPDEAGAIAARIKAAPLRLLAPKPIARAISSAGGVGFDEIDDTFMLRKRPGVFVAGEMLDWEAPTGGYLLQACFSTGVATGDAAARWLARESAEEPQT